MVIKRTYTFPNLLQIYSSASGRELEADMKLGERELQEAEE